MRVFLGLLLLLLLLAVDALKILVYNPKYGVSHVNTLGRICDILVKAGHDVVMLQPEMDIEMKTNGSKLARIVHIPPSEDTTKYMKLFRSESVEGMWTGGNIGALLSMGQYQMQMVEAQCIETFSHKDTLDALKVENFDFALTEIVDTCGVSILSYLNMTKWAITLTTGMVEHFDSMSGLPISASYVPGCLFGMTDRMSFLERVQNYLASLTFSVAVPMMASAQDGMVKAIGVEVPRFMDYALTNSLIFVNADPLLDFPRPTLHKFVSIGGISVPPKEETNGTLDQEWSSLLSLRRQTVVISFGTMSLAYLMPQEYKDGLHQLFRSLHYATFIMKYEKPDDGFGEGYENVMLREWLPQKELLSDPRVSLFVTHAGLGSTYEAVLRTVPMDNMTVEVVVPIMGDQLRNGQILKRHGVALLLEKADLGRGGVLVDTVTMGLEDESLRENMTRLAATLADRPFTPQEMLVKNIEFAALHGPLSQLDPYGRQLSFFTFYSLDVLLFFVSILAVSSLFTYYTCLLCWRACKTVCGKKKTQEKRYESVAQ